MLLLIRRIRPLPRGLIYCLWAIPCLRLWLPFGISGKFSFFHLLPGTAFRVVSLPDTDLLTMNFAKAAEAYFPIVFKTDLMQRIFSIGGLIFVIVFAAGCIALVWSYWLGKGETRHAKELGKGIYCSPNVTAPEVHGILRPKIIFPEGFPKEAFAYALLHERAHVRRCDNFFRCVAVVTALLHWFNPLSWVFLKFFLEDMELACDARVLKTLSKEQAREYAHALLTAAAGKSLLVSPFGGAKIRVRIERVLSYRKLTLLSGIAFILFAVAVALALLLNASGGIYIG